MLKERTDWDPHPVKVLVGMLGIGALLFVPVLGLIVAMNYFTSWNGDVQQGISGVLGIAAGLPGIFYSINRWG